MMSCGVKRFWTRADSCEGELSPHKDTIRSPDLGALLQTRWELE